MKKKIVALMLIMCSLAASITSYASPSSESEEVSTTSTTSTVSELAATYTNNLITGRTNGTYAKSIAYSANWYQSSSIGAYIEVVNRTVFGEAPFWITDKRAVALTIYYRRLSNDTSFYGADRSLYGVVVKPMQFAALTGSSGATEAARMPQLASNWTSKWDNCATAVGAIWGAVVGNGSPSEAMAIPVGYSGQLFFRSPGTFFGTGINNPVMDESKSHAYDLNGAAYYMAVDENGNVTRSRIKDICVPGVGVYQTVAAARTAYVNSGRGFDSTDDTCNVYFSYGN